MKRKGRRKPNQRLDPYRVAQALQRKTANLAKRKQLQQERETALGDPVRSKPTPFLESLAMSSSTNAPNLAENEQHLNYEVTSEMTEKQLAHSKWLTEPLLRRDGQPTDPEHHAKLTEVHEKLHENAQKAIGSITSITNASQGDKQRINIQRCIETFGRHNTDSVLSPKPASLDLGTGIGNLSVPASHRSIPDVPRKPALLRPFPEPHLPFSSGSDHIPLHKRDDLTPEQEAWSQERASQLKAWRQERDAYLAWWHSPASIEQRLAHIPPEEQPKERERLTRLTLLRMLSSVPKRSGPDTGSSEVQIAILTTKINNLANNLHNKDKNGKRDLRLLVHRRQKLLKYLRRKERGGPRWQNIVELLGINDAMWKGEISLA